MFIDSAKNTIRIAGLDDGITDDGTHYLFRMRRDGSKFYMDNRDAEPTENNYKDASVFLSEITELSINSEQAKDLLSLYPQVRIKIAVYNGISDTDVRDGLRFISAHFFLGCAWPTFGDEVDAVVFVRLLQEQALLMGYTLINDPIKN